MPDVFRCLRCEYSCAYLLPICVHEAAGASGARHSPRPRSSGAKHFWHSSSAARGENVDGCRRHSKARMQRAKSRDSGRQQRVARNDGLRRIASHALAMALDQLELGCLTIASEICPDRRRCARSFLHAAPRSLHWVYRRLAGRSIRGIRILFSLRLFSKRNDARRPIP